MKRGSKQEVCCRTPNVNVAAGMNAYTRKVKTGGTSYKDKKDIVRTQDEQEFKSKNIRKKKNREGWYLNRVRNNSSSPQAAHPRLVYYVSRSSPTDSSRPSFEPQEPTSMQNATYTTRRIRTHTRTTRHIHSCHCSTPRASSALEYV